MYILYLGGIMSEEFKAKELVRVILDEEGIKVPEEKLPTLIDKAIEKCGDINDMDEFKRCVIDVVKESEEEETQD